MFRGQSPQQICFFNNGAITESTLIHQCSSFMLLAERVAWRKSVSHVAATDRIVYGTQEEKTCFIVLQ